MRLKKKILSMSPKAWTARPGEPGSPLDAESNQPDSWLCSLCGKEPEVMHSTDPNICVKCYDAKAPGSPPTYVGGERVVTPHGAGTVHYVRLGKTDRDSSVSVLLDKKKNVVNYDGTLFLAELVTPEPKRVSRNRRGKE